MQNLTLYPSKTNLKLAMAVGVGTFALGLYLPTIGSTATPVSGLDMQTVGMVANGAGIWFLARGAMGLARPKPVFEATADGFSVNGKKMRPWSQYRGVAIHSMSYAFIGVGKFLRVKVGKSMLGGYVQINPLQLSGPAHTMAHKIDEFARAVAVSGAVEAYQVPPVGSAMDPAVQHPVRANHPIDVVAVADVAARPKPIAQRMQAGGESPVQSVPSLSEKLFGRRKVI